jgi:hypothetical protein
MDGIEQVSEGVFITVMLAANLQYYAEKSSAIDTIRDIFFLCN